MLLTSVHSFYYFSSVTVCAPVAQRFFSDSCNDCTLPLQQIILFSVITITTNSCIKRHYLVYLYLFNSWMYASGPLKDLHIAEYHDHHPHPKQLRYKTELSTGNTTPRPYLVASRHALTANYPQCCAA